MLEWLDVAGSINEAHLCVRDGTTTALDLPGAGLIWNEKAIARYAA
jgi:mandelate racemase